MRKELLFLKKCLKLTVIALFLKIELAEAVVQILNPLNVSDFNTLLLRIAQGIGGLIGAIGTIMFVVAGAQFLLAGGSPEKINQAKTTLIYAVLGMIIGFGAGALATAVLNIMQGKPV